MTNRIREAFLDQANWCTQLGSPFTAQVCTLFADRLSDNIPIARTLHEWPGDPSSRGDVVPLRVAAALHWLALAGRSSELAEAYPPHSTTDDQLWSAIEAALLDPANQDALQGHLASPPQTNEVMRSAVLLPGLLQVAELTGTPLHLYEIGSSAGLNLIPDRYRYRFAAACWGDAASPLLLTPAWTGGPPPVAANLRILSRSGVDAHPVDLGSPAARLRLLSYVWADQAERRQRLEAAIETFTANPPTVEKADAADWVERSLPARFSGVGARVVYHSIVWGYLSAPTQHRIEQRIRECAASATKTAPFAWLRFELATNAAEVKLDVWPGGETLLLARAHPHGSIVEWLN